MKTFATILFVFCATIFSIPAHALAPYAAPVEVDMLATPIYKNTWKVLVTSTARAVKGIFVANGSTAPLEIGVIKAGATQDTESAQIIVPASTPLGALYPLSIPSFPVRLSVISIGVGTSASSGLLDVSVLY